MIEVITAVVVVIITIFSGGDDSNKQQNDPENASPTGEATSALVAKSPAEGTSSNGQNQTSIPTPALLPGLVGLGLGVLRKRKSEEVETEV